MQNAKAVSGSRIAIAVIALACGAALLWLWGASGSSEPARPVERPVITGSGRTATEARSVSSEAPAVAEQLPERSSAEPELAVPHCARHQLVSGVLARARARLRGEVLVDWREKQLGRLDDVPADERPHAEMLLAAAVHAELRYREERLNALEAHIAGGGDLESSGSLGRGNGTGGMLFAGDHTAHYFLPFRDHPELARADAARQETATRLDRYLNGPPEPQPDPTVLRPSRNLKLAEPETVIFELHNRGRPVVGLPR